jgi:hypothetical protein
MMNVDKLKNLMKIHRSFLAKLYTSENGMICKNFLNVASETQLRMLICLLHCISKGVIPIRKAQFEGIQSARKSKYIFKNFATKLQTNKLLKASRGDKMVVLYKLCNSYHHLLFR